MQKNSIKTVALGGLLLALALSGCKKDNTTEQEVITTVVVELIPADGSAIQHFEWNDLDGDGGNAPQVDNLVLLAGKTFLCQLQVFDRSKTPEANITTEIEAENTKHLFVFAPDGVNLTVLGADTDDTGKPFRLQTVWTTGTVSVGLLNILLKHEPDKDASNPDATGETDFEVAFPVRIQ
ncbi:MAG: hypothetical protein IPH12_20900 [Saprospirales bacterium]|nr:hypothetical protein [Saprospirales bacterium]MBK8922008.1 hypothetical protein [Saprospirales bacterium]